MRLHRKMMGGLLAALALCLAPLSASAQQAATQEQMLREISQKAAAVTSLHCDFVQTKHSKMLGDKVVSTGSMRYAKPDTLRWEYAAPNVFVLSMEGSSVRMQKQEGKSLVDVKGNKFVKRLANLILASVTGECIADQKMFQSSAMEVGDSYVVTLIPKRKEMKQMFPKMELTFSKRMEMATKVVMHEANGDFTVIEFEKR